MKPVTEEEKDILINALLNFLSSMPFSIEEWLNDEERNIYQRYNNIDDDIDDEDEL